MLLMARQFAPEALISHHILSSLANALDLPGA
jgi:hypothetical protein